MAKEVSLVDEVRELKAMMEDVSLGPEFVSQHANIISELNDSLLLSIDGAVQTIQDVVLDEFSGLKTSSVKLESNTEQILQILQRHLVPKEASPDKIELPADPLTSWITELYDTHPRLQGRSWKSSLVEKIRKIFQEEFVETLEEIIEEAEIFTSDFFQARGVPKVMSDVLDSEIRRKYESSLLNKREKSEAGSKSKMRKEEKRKSMEERRLQREAKSSQLKLQRMEEKERKMTEKKLKHEQNGQNESAKPNLSFEEESEEDENGSECNATGEENSETFSHVTTQAPTPKKSLIFDILNYSHSFFLPRSGWNCHSAMSIARSFVNACQRSGWTLKVYLNEKIPLCVRSKKWKLDCERMIKRELRDDPPGLAILLGDIFRKCGVEVLYPAEGEDEKDSTLASIAHFENADIISREKDLFRYVGCQYSVYSNFKIAKNGFVKLTSHKLHSRATQASPLSLRSTPPRIFNEVNAFLTPVYLCDSPSPLIRQLGVNPYETLAPLRRALYSLIGNSGPVTEMWPCWSDSLGSVTWKEVRDVYPSHDPELVNLLSSPEEAMNRFFPQEWQSVLPPQGVTEIDAEDWRKHCFCVRSLVSEIISIASRYVSIGPEGKRSLSLVDLFLEFEDV